MAVNNDLSEVTEVASSIDHLSKPELFFGIVRTMGADHKVVIDELKTQMSNSGYKQIVIRLSEQIADSDNSESLNDRYERLMDEGDRLRINSGNSAAVAIRGIHRLRQERAALQGVNKAGRGVAWVFDGLMHADEIKLLRDVYGRRFFAISCDAPEPARLASLASRISQQGEPANKAQTDALGLLLRSAGSDREPASTDSFDYRLSVRDAFLFGDLFVRVDRNDQTRDHVTRLVQCIMSFPFHATSLDEIGMGLAFKMKLASAALSRTVGAVIMVDDQVCAVGYNEVPRYPGGVYHEYSQPDGREYKRDGDPSDPTRLELLTDIIKRFQCFGLVDKKIGLAKDLAREHLNEAKRSKMFDVIEYGRCAHAEIVAITGAARRGVSIAGATLYATTMPCHECTRAIVAAGIIRVVYIEPYIKSRGPALQHDSVALVPAEGDHPSRVIFELFTGIGEGRLDDLFAWVPRKQSDSSEADFTGLPINWEPREAAVRPSLFNPDLAEAEFAVIKIREDVVCGKVKPYFPGSARPSDDTKMQGSKNGAPRSRPRVANRARAGSSRPTTSRNEPDSTKAEKASKPAKKASSAKKAATRSRN